MSSDSNIIGYIQDFPSKDQAKPRHAISHLCGKKTVEKRFYMRAILPIQGALPKAPQVKRSAADKATITPDLKLQVCKKGRTAPSRPQSRFG